jgi:hypothetical protein
MQGGTAFFPDLFRTLTRFQAVSQLVAAGFPDPVTRGTVLIFGCAMIKESWLAGHFSTELS